MSHDPTCRSNLWLTSIPPVQLTCDCRKEKDEALLAEMAAFAGAYPLRVGLERECWDIPPDAA